MTSRPRRWRVEPTDEWGQVELLRGWPEQRDYELIRPPDGRSQETGASSGRTLRRKAARFEAEGMESLFGSQTARRRQLPPAIRPRHYSEVCTGGGPSVAAVVRPPQ
jgi:hypothetical protein